ncbi:MAG: DNA mismatch repair endonuclease MutH [Polyangiaceae bacterium]|nr:DNA mismatch repair endonuclease MutH [Polyangiaceae bacterium]
MKSKQAGFGVHAPGDERPAAARPSFAPPQSEAELLARAARLVGLSLGELAAKHAITPPDDLKRAKGFVGQLLEKALGTTASTRAAPDFEELGVELKSLPVDRRGHPVESTFVCTISLREVGESEWEKSKAWAKLRRVLWVPVEGERAIAPSQRRIGTPLIWSPSAEQEAQLRADWDHLGTLIFAGRVDDITAHLGTYLQVRPKAKNALARRSYWDEEGAVTSTLPRGFYLRASFTAGILKDNFVLPR